MELIQFLHAAYEFKNHKAVIYKKSNGYAAEISESSNGKTQTYFVSLLEFPTLFQVETLIRKYFKG